MLQDIKNAISEFEKGFEEVKGKDKRDGDRQQIVVWSGGATGWDEVAPALYSTENAAVQAWFEAATRRVAEGDMVLEWIMYPDLKEYQMTMADHRQMQRVVTSRFSVKSQFKVRGKDGN